MKTHTVRHVMYTDMISTVIKSYPQIVNCEFQASIRGDSLMVSDVVLSTSDLPKFIAFLQEVEKAELRQTPGKRVLLMVDGGYIVRAVEDDNFDVQLTNDKKYAWIFDTNSPEFVDLMNRATNAGVEVRVVDV
jgi:hypothetical protein